MKVIIWWIRYDLRLHDNEALHTALTLGDAVVPCFIMDPVLLNECRTASKRCAFLFDALHSLDTSLRQRGSALLVQEGEPLAVLTRLRDILNATAIIAEADYSTKARDLDSRIAAYLPLHHVGGPTVHHPEEVLKKDGSPYTVFTPYKRAWLARPLPTRSMLLPPPQNIPTPPLPEGVPIPFNARLPDEFAPDETTARRRLRNFCTSAIAHYDETRNHLDVEGTSRLSPYLRFGLLSAREAVATALEAAREL